MPLTFHLASPQALIISNVSSYRRRQSSRCLPSSASNAQQMCFSANATMVLQHLLHLHCDYYSISREGVPDIAMVSNTIIKRVGCNMLQKGTCERWAVLELVQVAEGQERPCRPSNERSSLACNHRHILFRRAPHTFESIWSQQPHDRTSTGESTSVYFHWRRRQTKNLL